MNRIYARYAAVAATILLALAGCGRNPQLTPSNIDKVVKAMSLEEKARLVTGLLDADAADTVASLAVVKGEAGASFPIPRLGIPSIVFANGPAGVNLEAQCTQFPIATSLAASWDRELVEQVGTAIGEEALGNGVDVMLAPALNIHRNPLCGRNFEYFSEDPLLSGKTAAAYVRGVQKNGVAANIKHLVANNQETNRKKNDARISPRALREIYLKGFEIAVRESSPKTLMTSYNLVNGTYVSERRDLLTTVLRDEWHYEGTVMTWATSANIPAQVAAGNDFIRSVKSDDYKVVIEAVKEGRLSKADLDRNVRRILKMIVESPTFADAPRPAPDYEKNAAIARSSAADGMVLLENRDSILPLMDTVKYVALYGEASLKTIAGGLGSGTVNCAHITSVAEGLESAGYEIVADKDSADVAIITISRISGAGADRELTDYILNKEERKLISETCRVFHLVGKKVIVLLNIGSTIEIAPWKDEPDAILLIWLPGQESGHSVADILTGKVCPSGKLPMTFPVGYADAASTANFPVNAKSAYADSVGRNVDYTLYQEGIYVGYRYFDTFNKGVVYPFGYGLSYTNFTYDEPEVIMRRRSIKVYVDITNTGTVAGREVAQLYIQAPLGSLEKPSKELKGWCKTPLLEPGEKFTATFTVPLRALASFNESSASWTVDAGTYIIKVGGSSRDIVSEAALDLDESYQYETNDVLTLQQPINELRYRRSIFRERIRPANNDTVKAVKPAAFNPNGPVPEKLNPYASEPGYVPPVDTLKPATDSIASAEVSVDSTAGADPIEVKEAIAAEKDSVAAAATQAASDTTATENKSSRSKKNKRNDITTVLGLF